MSEQRKKPRVFVVDDEEIISSTIAEILSRRGFQATPFTRPLEALAASRTKMPDLLISDIVMPLMSGIDLGIRLQQASPACKVLLFSGQWDTFEFLEAACGREQNFELIQKPIHPRDLIKKALEMTAGVPSLVSDGEDRARKTLAENMRQAVAEVRVEIAASTARKRPLKPRAVPDPGD